MTNQERLLNVSDDGKKCNDKVEKAEEVTQTDLCSSWQDELEDLELSCQSDTCGDGGNAFLQKSDSITNVKVEFGEGEGKEGFGLADVRRPQCGERNETSDRRERESNKGCVEIFEVI